jgi:hypothetical protein
MIDSLIDVDVPSLASIDFVESKGSNFSDTYIKEESRGTFEMWL